MCLSLILTYRGKRFDTGDAFVGYQKDTPAAVVFQASNFLRRMREDDVRDVIESKLELLNKAGILDIISPDMLLDTIDTDEHWKRAVREFATCKSVVSLSYIPV